MKQVGGDALKLINIINEAAERGRSADSLAVGKALGGLNRLIGSGLRGVSVMPALSGLALQEFGIQLSDHGRLQATARMPKGEKPVEARNDPITQFIQQRRSAVARELPEYSNVLLGEARSASVLVIRGLARAAAANNNTENLTLRKNNSPALRLAAFMSIAGAEAAVIDIRQCCQGPRAISTQGKLFRRVVEDWHQNRQETNPYAQRLGDFGLEPAVAGAAVMPPSEQSGGIGLYTVEYPLLSAQRSIALVKRYSGRTTPELVRADSALSVVATVEYAILPDAWQVLRDDDHDAQTEFLDHAVQGGPESYADYLRPSVTAYRAHQRWEADIQPIET